MDDCHVDAPGLDSYAVASWAERVGGTNVFPDISSFRLFAYSCFSAARRVQVMSSLLGALSGKSPDQQSLLSVKVEGEPQRISINHLSRTSPSGQKILDNCSLDISAGQIVGLIGPSGSGKSTLLRAVNRLWEPEAGTIFVDGKDITKESVISVRKRIGMLFQTAALFDGA